MLFVYVFVAAALHHDKSKKPLGSTLDVRGKARGNDQRFIK